ncbi:unnamed protein product [Dovyalis caffra]|uniref:Fe2OG dioxygenase domain-containing protein n=1 Tax=Dovyalis caffra TaxID=77055 RepID=A0AAV1RDL7_9ROSI|nr:unnamed protein product [Dovyalis caffra]
MGLESKKFEWTLPVPNVQELSTQQLETVPARFVRDDVCGVINTVPSDDCLPVPLIDMSKLANPEFQELELQKLRSACKDWGIFQLINHGMSDEILRNTSKEVLEFFQLPLTEKNRWKQKPGRFEGYGQILVASEEAKLDWNDMLLLTTHPIQNRELEFWPENPPKLREYLDKYSEDIKQVAINLTRFFAMGLAIEGQELCEAFQEGGFRVKMNYYPPCPQPEKVLGLKQHTDSSMFNLLLDCSITPGLQVLKDGHWYFVKPIDGAIVANLGLFAEMVSNGIYKAPLHRAVVNNSQTRISIVTACLPNSSFNVGPAKELTKAGTPPLYKTVTVDEFFSMFLQSKKLGVPVIDTLKISC